MIAYVGNENDSGTCATMYITADSDGTATYSGNEFTHCVAKSTEKDEIQIIKNPPQKFCKILKFLMPLSSDNKRARKNNRQMLIKRRFSQGIEQIMSELLILLFLIRI